MKYVSTRGGSGVISFMGAVIEGLAPDGGLYVPGEYPQITEIEFDECRAVTYRRVAKIILSKFASDVPRQDLLRIIDDTYSTAVFGNNAITPVEELAPGLSLLRLSNGPTLAFKDVPLQLLGRLMEYVLGKLGEELNVLAGTSGDTGSAGEYALRRRKGIRVFMLSPYGRMSAFQQQQMYTLNEPNIFNLAVDGNFDACQDVVKEVNEDITFKTAYKIGAINSINWARIAAQVVYYVYAYTRVTRSNSEQVSFSVPSGNFGNALSAHIARQMGVPIREIIVATNSNDVLDEFFRTGEYRVRSGSEVLATSSPSMDIAKASNLERLVFDIVGRDSTLVSELYTNLKQTGGFSLGSFFEKGRLPGFHSGVCSDSEVLETIKTVYAQFGLLIDPHTAVAMKVGLARKETDVPLIIVETAQPAKFADTMRAALGFEPPVPKGYEEMDKLPQYVTRVPPDPEVVKDFIRKHAT